MRESQRERTFIDDIVQKDHLQRALLDSLEGVRTVFDGGAGSGRFSILLAQRGLSVTHFDISAPMIDQAREAAQAAGALDRITFVQGALEDLSAYADGAFDLVISFDAPICYTYPNHERVIASLARIARKRLLVSVASRLGALPYYANPLQKHPYILSDQPEDPWARWCLEHEADLVADFRFDKAGAEDFLARGYPARRRPSPPTRPGGPLAHHLPLHARRAQAHPGGKRPARRAPGRARGLRAHPAPPHPAQAHGRPGPAAGFSGLLLPVRPKSLCAGHGQGQSLSPGREMIPPQKSAVPLGTALMI